MDEIPIIFHHISKMNKKIHKLMNWKDRQIKNEKMAFNRLMEGWLQENIRNKLMLGDGSSAQINQNGFTLP